jgi:hypothetical protein
MTSNKKTEHTMYYTFIRSVVTHSFACPVAPVIALYSARTHEIPATGPRMDIQIHPGVLALEGNGAEAGDGKWRVIGSVLAFAAHGCGKYV